MPFYEVCFETGRTSIAFYEDDAEAERALSEQHRRAIHGEPDGPLGGPAERVAKVYVYDRHPNDYNVEQTMSAEVMEKELSALVKKMKDENNIVPIDLLAMEVRAISHPMVEAREAGFGSIFKMKENKALDMAFLEGVE
jgi:hypothetical protein